MKALSVIVLSLFSFPLVASDQLFEAIEKGNKELVRRVLAQKVDVNAQDKEGNTPLIKAVEKGNEEIINRLLSKGAKVDLANKEGETPLIKAAQQNNSAIAKLLIGKKADINDKTKEGITPLFFFAGSGNKDMVNYLVGKKADVNAVGEKGDSPVQRALHGGHVPILQILLPKLDKTAYNEDTGTQLFVSAFFGDDKKVESLLNGGAEAEQSNAFGDTPLTFAAQRGHVKVAKLLVDYGASGKHLSEMLYDLFIKGKKDIGMILVAAGADPNKSGHYGGTPLMAAAKNKDAALIKFLSEKGADPNKRDIEGNTALLFACRTGSFDAVKAMIEVPKVNINNVNNHGETALTSTMRSLQRTEQKPSKEVVAALLAAGATPVVGKPGEKGDAIALAKKLKATQVVKLLEEAKE